MSQLIEPNNMRKILDDPNKCISSSANDITRLWRTMLLEQKITPKIFEILIKDYLHNPNSGIEDNPTARNNHRGNLTKELSTNNMTLKSFMKGLRLLQVEEFDLSITVKRLNVPHLVRHSVHTKNNIRYERVLGSFDNANIVDSFDKQVKLARDILDAQPESKPRTDISGLLKGFKLPSGAKPANDTSVNQAEVV